MTKLFPLILLLTFLVGCTTVETRYLRTEIPVIHPEEPQPLVLEDVEWKVWNYDRLNEAAQNSDNVNQVYYVLDTDGLRSLARNIARALEFTEVTLIHKQFYKDIINDYNQRIRDEKEQQ